MINAPSSTWFTVNPHWHWLIITYFFIGGIAGGCYFIAVLLDLLGRPEDRRLARLGYYIAFPCVLLSGLLLTVDLSRPERFWHMLIQSNTSGLMFKPWSPMSVGSWVLLVFGLFTFASFMAALAEEDRVRWPWARRFQYPALRALRPPSALGVILVLIGAVGGLFIAGYTGVLISATNRPIWADTSLFGMLFIISAASSSAALLMWLAHRYGWRALPGVAALHRMDGIVLGLELLALIALLATLGPAIRGWMSIWGVLLLVVMIGGIIVPLRITWRHRVLDDRTVATIGSLVLIGAFLLRVAVIFSSETI